MCIILLLLLFHLRIVYDNKYIKILNYHYKVFYSNLHVLVLCDDLYDSMKEYCKSLKKYKNFNDEFFCFGYDYGITPISHPKDQRRKKLLLKKLTLKK